MSGKKIIEGLEQARDGKFHPREVLVLGNDDLALLWQLLNPRRWTREMNAAWHLNIPNTQAAFDALRAIALQHSGEQSGELSFPEEASQEADGGQSKQGGSNPANPT